MASNNQITIQVPEKLYPIFFYEGRYICLDGGRGSAKSWTVAYFLLMKGMILRKRILCTREIQNTIADSVYKLLCDQIAQYPYFERFYEVKKNSIIGANGTEFIFKGLFRNTQDIKSMEGIDYCWVEEAQSVSRASLTVLLPTIRKEGSQIIFTYNPTNDDDPVHVDYNLTKRDDCLHITINYDENPWFPEVLRREMLWDRAHDIDKYYHIWRGQCVKHSKAQVFFGKWIVDTFETPEGIFFYLGADWGFSLSPNVFLRCFIQGRKLYIDYEVYEVEMDLEQIPGAFAAVPDGDKFPSIADSARPETIKYVSQRGYPLMKPTQKGKKSIEDGIMFIRSFDQIVIHPRCKHTIDEFRLYQFKVDAHTGAISTKIEDKNNHCIDSVRYALEDLMMKFRSDMFKFFDAQTAEMEGTKPVGKLVPKVKIQGTTEKVLTEEDKKEIERLQSVDAQAFLAELQNKHGR